MQGGGGILSNRINNIFIYGSAVVDEDVSSIRFTIVGSE